MNSCIYEGQVSHARVAPVQHRFHYRLFMMYLDLDELPTLFDRFWLWSADKAALARFKRTDHLGDARQLLIESVRDTVEAETGERPQGPIRLLTNLSYFGYCFNPVSFYYCFSQDDSKVDFIVSEVNNTPWGERASYVMPCTSANDRSGPWRFNPSKTMHVSPFMPMEVDYNWLLTSPGDELNVHMSNTIDGVKKFSATLALTRREISSRSLAGVLIRFPLMTTKVIVAIYWQALRLWLKRTPIHAHPDKQKEVTAL